MSIIPYVIAIFCIGAVLAMTLVPVVGKLLAAMILGIGILVSVVLLAAAAQEITSLFDKRGK